MTSNGSENREGVWVPLQPLATKTQTSGSGSRSGSTVVSDQYQSGPHHRWGPSSSGPFQSEDSGALPNSNQSAPNQESMGSAPPARTGRTGPYWNDEDSDDGESFWKKCLRTLSCQEKVVPDEFVSQLQVDRQTQARLDEEAAERTRRAQEARQQAEETSRWTVGDNDPVM